MLHNISPGAFSEISDQQANVGLPLGSGIVFVEAGSLDVLLADPAHAGSRERLLTISAGEAAFPIENAAGSFDLIGFPSAATRLLTVQPEAFKRLLDAGDDAAIRLAETWVEKVARVLAPPTDERTAVLTAATIRLSSKAPARPTHGLLWVTTQEGSVRPDIAPDMLLAPGAPALPVSAGTSGAILADGGSAPIACRDSRALAASGGLSEAFFTYGRYVAHAIGKRLEAGAAQQAEEIRQASQRLLTTTTRPFLGLALRKGHAPTVETDDALASVFRQVAAANSVVVPPDAFDHCPSPDNALPDERLAAFARAAGMRLRPVRLQGKWWRQAGQSIIAFDRADNAPAAAIARTGWRRGYDVRRFDGPTSGDRISPALLGDTGYVLQRTLPNEPIDGRGLMRFAAPLAVPLMIPIMMVALISALLGLATPLATQVLFETIIPSSSSPQLMQLAAGLAGLSIGMTLFGLVRGFLLLRLSTLLNADLEGAMWSKLLRLPAGFFRDYTTGDLAMRAGAINQMRDTIAGTILGTFLTSVFSIANLGLLFYYSVPLAWVSLAIVVVQVTITIGISSTMVGLSRQALAIDGRLQSFSLQIINAIGKLKVAGAEARAFARWATPYLARRDLELRSRRLSTIVDVSGALFSVLALAIIIWFVGFRDVEIGIGEFAAFNSAFGQFLGSTLALAGVVPALLQLRPLYERAKPLLQAVPEDQGNRVDPGRLRGEIELNDVVFRYSADGPTILDKLSLRARPGEFIGIVGPSGAGKSTVLRLLLGFEQASSGSVFFDQKDSSSLDMQAIRRQMGVVLQNGYAGSGSVLENIVGGADLTENDAWEAARLAGLEDDIRQMPMQMHSFAGENAMLLSGGQRQRLMIARAVVRRPRVLLFDEATSALDNRSQQIVSERLAALEATRIVIAHRLSTIMAADRIYVLEAGRVVEQGTYAELMAMNGLFATLARRQTA